MGFWNNFGRVARGRGDKVVDSIFGKDTFKNFLLGSPDKLEKIPTHNKEQDKLHQELLSQLRGGQEGYNEANEFNRQNLQRGNEGIDDFKQFLDPYQNKEAFKQFSDPYMTQFNEEILPGIAERYANNLSSSSFSQALGGAASGMQSQLAKLFAQLVGNYQTGRRSDEQFRQNSQQNSANSLTNQYQNLTNTALSYEPFAYNKKKGSTGFLGPMLGGVGTAVAGPLGGQLAGQFGNSVSENYNGR